MAEGTETPTVMGYADFIQLLIDAALLSRGNDDCRFIDGQWPSDTVKLECYQHDAWWMCPLVAAFVEALIDDLDAHGGQTMVPSSYGDPYMTNFGYRTNDRLSGFAGWFAQWAVAAASKALSSSQNIPPVVMFKHDRRGTFVIDRKSFQGTWIIRHTVKRSV